MRKKDKTEHPLYLSSPSLSSSILGLFFPSAVFLRLLWVALNLTCVSSQADLLLNTIKFINALRFKQFPLWG